MPLELSSSDNLRYEHTQSRNRLVQEDERAHPRDCPRRIEAGPARSEGLVSVDREHGPDSLVEKSGFAGCDPQNFAAILDRACRNHRTEEAEPVAHHQDHAALRACRSNTAEERSTRTQSSLQTRRIDNGIGSVTNPTLRARRDEREGWSNRRTY